jgi:hypothetical protein
MNRPNSNQFDVIGDLANALLTHPHFEKTVHYFCNNTIEWRREIGFINHLVTNYSRHLIVYYICSLHFANQTELPEGGATFSRVWEIVERRKDCGSRALRTILGVLTLVGYLRKVPGEIDKRTYAYEPTEKLLSHLSKHMIYMFRCFDILLNTDQYSKRMTEDPQYLADVMKYGGKAVFEHDIVLLESEHEFVKILHMPGGTQTLYSIARSQIMQVDFPKPAELSKKYKVSMRQARSVIDYSVANGIMELDADGNLSSALGATRLVRFALARELAIYAKFALGLEEILMAHIKA